MALSLPETSEGSHQQHPDFRVGGKIFATLGYPDDGHGMVRLTPGQQADVMETDRTSAFAPSAGAWGRGGATTVLLKNADRELLRIAMTAAWRNAIPRPASRATAAGTGGRRPRKPATGKKPPE